LFRSISHLSGFERLLILTMNQFSLDAQDEVRDLEAAIDRCDLKAYSPTAA